MVTWNSQKHLEANSRRSAYLGVAQSLTARVAQVLVLGSIYQGAILVHIFEPRPCMGCFTGPVDFA